MCIITMGIPKLLLKNFLLFFFTVYKNEWKECKFWQILFYENKKVTKIHDIDVDKILVSKEEPYGKKIHLNTLLDTMIMMLLDHYV